PPLHAEPAARDPAPGRARRRSHGHPRHRAATDRLAAGMPLPWPLPARVREVPRAAPPLRGRARAPQPLLARAGRGPPMSTQPDQPLTAPAEVVDTLPPARGDSDLGGRTVDDVAPP